jgi:hypothetical protein
MTDPLCFPFQASFVLEQASSLSVAYFIRAYGTVCPVDEFPVEAPEAGCQPTVQLNHHPASDGK